MSTVHWLPKSRPALAVLALSLFAVAMCAAPRLQGNAAPPQAGLLPGKVLLENDRVLVIEGLAVPNQPGAMHKHALAALVVCIEGAKMKETLPDGSTQTYERKPGDVMWREAGLVHSETNLGQTRLRVIAVQLK